MKTAVQLIRGSKSSRNIAQFDEQILYKPLKLSGHHRGNILDRIFLGMRLRSDEILVGPTRGAIKTRTLRRRVEEEQSDTEFARCINRESRQPVPGINSDHVPAAISDRAGVPVEEHQADARLGHQDEDIDPPESTVNFDATRQTCHPSTFRYVEENVRPEKFGQEVLPGCATIGSHHHASHSDTCRDRMRAELEKSEEGREYVAREQARVDARKQEQSSSSSQKRAVSEEWDRPLEKVWRMDEEDVTMRQDVTATSGASSSSASRGPAMAIESQPSRKRAACVQSENLEDNEQMGANDSAEHSPQAEEESSDGRMFIGSWEHDESETQNQHLEDKVAGDEYLGLDESMDITTVNEQGVHGILPNVEMRNQAYKKIVAEKPLLLVGAHPCASWR